MEYTLVFDENITTWSTRQDHNRFFLQCQQNYFNNLLQSRGHVLLNDIYDALGVDRTVDGALVGWLKEDKNSFISFGLEDINDYSNALLNFNIQGMIFYKI